MRKKIIVSVIIPTFNRQHLVRQAINSVLNQTYIGYEIIVVDDGSSDDTEVVVKEIHNQRIRYLYQSNAGLAAARNTGIRSARGEYVAFLDDDDYWLPDKLLRQVEAMQNHPEVGMLSSGWININEKSEVISESRPWEWCPVLDINTWIRTCPVIPSSVLVKTAWMKDIGGFDESISRARLGGEDYDAWLRLSYAGCQMMYEQSLACVYRNHQGSMSQNLVRQMQGILTIMEKFFSQKDLPIALQSKRARAIANVYLIGARCLYAGELVEEAKKSLAEAVKLEPALLANGGEEIFTSLLDQVTKPNVDNNIKYVKTFLNNLPDEIEVSVKRKRQIQGRAAKIVFFTAHKRGDRRRMIVSLFWMAANQPKFLNERGIISVLLDMLVGPKNASRLKSKYRKA